MRRITNKEQLDNLATAVRLLMLNAEVARLSLQREGPERALSMLRNINNWPGMKACERELEAMCSQKQT